MRRSIPRQNAGVDGESLESDSASYGWDRMPAYARLHAHTITSRNSRSRKRRKARHREIDNTFLLQWLIPTDCVCCEMITLQCGMHVTRAYRKESVRRNTKRITLTKVAEDFRGPLTPAQAVGSAANSTLAAKVSIEPLILHSSLFSVTSQK